MHQTRAIQILHEKKIPHSVREFEAVEFTAAEVSEKLEIPEEQVFKTLVIEIEKKLFAALVPGTKELSLKKIAAALGGKRAELVPVDNLMRLTGYLKGGVSPLGSKRSLAVVCDSSILEHETVSVSAGKRGVQIILAPKGLIEATNAKLAPIAE